MVEYGRYAHAISIGTSFHLELGALSAYNNISNNNIKALLRLCVRGGGGGTYYDHDWLLL